jgi:phenylacetate-coenzyme A ligase PaaK-like adenylate-forming protein
MHKVLGRSDDMVIIRGGNVFQSWWKCSAKYTGVEPFYVLIVDRIGNLVYTGSSG